MIYLKQNFLSGSVIIAAMITVFAGMVKAEDPYKRQPVDDKIYQTYLEFFEYDRDIPTEGRVAFVEEPSEKFIREKIVFNSGFGELVPAYLGLPKDSSAAPFPCILATHGAGEGLSQGKNKRYVLKWMESLCNAGYAVFAIDARGHGERYYESGFRSVRDLTGKPHSRRDLFIRTVVDWRNAIDYLESRPDIDTGRLGLLGSSMGTMYGSILTAIENRIQAAVFVVGGVFPDNRAPRPPIDQLNYINRIAPRPVLMLNGLQDADWATDGAKKWFELAGELKAQFWFDTGHNLTDQIELYEEKLIEFFDTHIKNK